MEVESTEELSILQEELLKFLHDSYLSELPGDKRFSDGPLYPIGALDIEELEGMQSSFGLITDLDGWPSVFNIWIVTYVYPNEPGRVEVFVDQEVFKSLSELILPIIRDYILIKVESIREGNVSSWFDDWETVDTTPF